jgi:hypothetical protein
MDRDLDAIRSYVAERLGELNTQEGKLESGLNPWDQDYRRKIIKLNGLAAKATELERLWNRFFEKGD